MEEKKKVSLDEQFNDYESTPVPEHARRNWVDQGIVWMGAGLSILATGGLLADGLSFWDTVLASVLGAIVIFIIAGFVGLVSVRLHLSASYTARFSFGRDGSRIFGAILCFSNFGWFAFQADLFGNTVTSILREGWNLETPTVVFTILGGLAMATTAIFGFKAIEKFSKFSFPILLLLCVVAIWRTFSQVPAADIIGSGPVGAPITLPMGVAIVVSSYASGIAVIGDVSRFSRSKKDCLLGLSLGYVWGFIPILLCGSFFTYAFHNWNIVEVMIESLDMGILGAVGLIICQWTTNDNNLYTSVLGVTNTLDGIMNGGMLALSGLMLLGWKDEIVAAGQTALPNLFICNTIGWDWLVVCYSILLFCAFISTCVTLIYTMILRIDKKFFVKSDVHEKIRMSIIGVIMVAVCMSLSFIGISNIITYAYGYDGYLALVAIVLPVLIIGNKKNKKFIKEHPEAIDKSY